MLHFISSFQQHNDVDVDVDVKSCDVFYVNKSFDFKPEPSFILCRNEVGDSTAIYSSNRWDFNPVRLGTTIVTVIDFDRPLNGQQLTPELIEEIKSILFILIYISSNNGRVGRLSALVLYQHFRTLRSIGLFCVEQDNSILKGLSVKDVLSNESYLSLFISGLSNSKLNLMSLILFSLNNTEQRYLNFNPISQDFFEVDYSHNQTPIIPSRIYLDLMTKLETEINFIYPFKLRISNLIKMFKNEKIGYCLESQKNTIKGLGIKNGFLPTLDDLVINAELECFFIGHYQVTNKQGLMKVFNQIQSLLKLAIHFYTGMRRDEVLRLPYECTYDVTFDGLDDTEGGVKVIPDADVSTIVDTEINVEPRMIKLISTTTKFTGYRKEASWLAPDIIKKTVDILQAFTDGVAEIYDVEASSLPLFQSLNIICFRNTKAHHLSNFDKIKNFPTFNNFLITDEDREELCASDPDRTFDENEFKIGQPWRIKSHQLRRSLAFFGSNSGFLSQPNVQKQFKHTSLAMAQYYRRNFHKLLTIFGHYNEKTKTMEIPQDHVLFEFQTGIPLDKAKVIIEDVFNSEEKIFGKRGSYIERIRDGLEQNDIIIKQAINDTEQKALSGEISYKRTLLGGCMKNDKCDDFILGKMTSCISCPDSIIHLKKLDLMINQFEHELNVYHADSYEYNFVTKSLEKLRLFKSQQVING